MMTREEYQQKHKELQTLARSVDLWKQAPQTAEQKEKVATLMEELHAESFALECAFLDLKTRIFTDILAVLRKEK